ncbi:hypothetical protein ACFLV7_14255, partial [Chloroflexota bacterium]
MVLIQACSAEPSAQEIEKAIAQTEAAKPTETAAPTNTLLPTNTKTPFPTETPVPTETPIPTDTETPIRSFTAEPTEEIINADELAGFWEGNLPGTRGGNPITVQEGNLVILEGCEIGDTCGAFTMITRCSYEITL